MIYDSFDIIPIKLFFRIEQTGKINLLSTKKNNSKSLKEIWERIKEEHDEIDSKKIDYKTLNISKKIESLSVKNRVTNLAVFHLRNKKDDELINLLKDYRYNIDVDDLMTSLEVVEKENKALIGKINRLNERLPKKEESESKTTLDEVILSYASLTNSGFIDTNKITGTQYYALINLGNKKIKELENGKR